MKDSETARALKNILLPVYATISKTVFIKTTYLFVRAQKDHFIRVFKIISFSAFCTSNQCQLTGDDIYCFKGQQQHSLRNRKL